jgi:hypothetical protein
MRTLINDLSRQVQAQFTTIAAHAEIARQQAEFAREEARADLERTRALVIELVERTRHDLMTLGASGAFGASGSSSTPNERVAALETQVSDLIAGINRCFDRQRVLAETVEALFDAVMTEHHSQPVASLSLA